MGKGELMRTLPQMAEIVRAAQDRDLAQRPRDGVAERVVRARALRLERARARRASVTRFGAAAAAVVLAASVFLFLRMRPEAARSLSFEVAGMPGSPGAFVSTTDTSALLRFSDGSTVDLAPSSALRIADLTTEGADVVLERGTVHTHVVPRDGNRWTVAAGPYRVSVKGTRFDTTWDPATGRLRVAMSEGRVLVTGACLGAGRELVAGDVADVTCTDEAKTKRPEAIGTVAVETLPSAAPDVVNDAKTPTPATAPKDVSRTKSAASPIAATPAPAPGWIELARAGRVPEALDAAPIETVLATAPASELMLLAEVARRGGRNDLAERAYRSVRRRFAATPEAEQSTFLLARLVADTGRVAEADTLFGEYAKAAPSGVFAEEAAGRLLELALARGDKPRARELARSYVARFPRGAAADLARSLLLP